MTQLKAKKLSSRYKIIEIDDQFLDLDVIDLSRTVMILKDKNIRLDFGALCYKIHERCDYSKPTEQRESWLVDRSTYDETRLPFIKNLINYFRVKNNITPSTKRTIFIQIAAFITWIGKQSYFDTDFSDINSIKNAYVEYTKYLVWRKNLPENNKNKLKNNYASSLQKRARIAVSNMCGEKESIIKLWVAPIVWNDRELLTQTLTANPITDTDKKKSFASLCQGVHDAWMLIKRKKSRILLPNGEFEELDFYNSNDFEILYNKVAVAATLTFIGASGVNADVAIKSVIENTTSSSTIKGVRVVGIKARANHKEIDPEIAAIYTPVFKKWLDIRKIFLSRIGKESSLLFPYCGKGLNIKHLPNRNLESSGSWAQHYINKYNVKWVSPRKWRGFRSKLITDVTNGDILVEAEMQDHSVTVALKNYTNRDLTTAALEISKALDMIYQSAIKRTRHKDNISVNITSSRSNDSQIPAGECLCTEKLEPEITEGFTRLAPQPDCSIKETCIFCDKYAIHTNKEDIRKILSLKYLCNEMKLNMGNDEWTLKWSPYIHRVDEIIEEIRLKHPEINNLIVKITNEVEMGALDAFWLDYYETLYYLRLVS